MIKDDIDQTDIKKDMVIQPKASVKKEPLYQWKSIYESWYPAPIVTADELIYLNLIEKIFKVKYPDGKWDYIKLTNHQAEFHKNDLAIQKYSAKNEIVIKSRGTSFTTNSIIRMCMNAYSYQDQLPPVVRINDTKVKELIENDFKDIVEHMTPVQMIYNDEDGKEVTEYVPFRVENIQYTAHEIYIPDRNIRITGYPANSRSSENIRGNRINFGLMDETNYIMSFQNVDTAMLDASRGAVLSGEDKGKVAYQATYGTTRKGKYTSFNLWFENVERLIDFGKLKKFRIYKWPALNPALVDLTKPLTEQKLVPIAPWQTLEYLEQRRIQNLNRFKEEYMAMLTDEQGKLYDMKFIQDNLIQDASISGEKFKDKQGSWWIGVDPAYSSDFFSISIFNKVLNEKTNKEQFLQTYIYYERNVDLTFMQDVCQDIVEHYLPLGLQLMSIDGNGLGVQLSNYLRKLFPDHVRLFRGARVKLMGKTATSISIKEYIHTNQIDLQYQKAVKYLHDPIQIMHFSGWNQKYEFETVEDMAADDMAHGDTTIANGLALLPKNLNSLRSSFDSVILGNTLTSKDVEVRDDSGKDMKQKLDEKDERSESVHKRIEQITLGDKLKMYKNIKFRGGGL